MQVIRYDLIGAYKAGIKEHPERNVIKLGMNVSKYEGMMIADCVFMEVDKLPDELPDYITLSDWKFTLTTI